MYKQLVNGLVIGSVGVLFASAALALEPCNEVVVDNANILSTNDENRIATAAAELAALGVTVRVRTSLDHGSFSSLQVAADTVCANLWGGDRMVYWVATDTRDVGMYTGLAWEGKITPSIQSQIIDNEMMPALRNSSFATAFIQAILKTKNICVQYQR